MAKSSYKPKSTRPFGRALPIKKKRGSSFLILTEGVNTEPLYFDALKKHLGSPMVTIVCHGEGAGDPSVLVKAALREKETRKRQAKNQELAYNQTSTFDNIWIVFDTDVITPAKLNIGLAVAKKHNINVAASTPCFEFWLLLHYKYTTALFADCDAILKELSKQSGTRWSKEKSTCIQLIQSIIDQAKEASANAAHVRKHHEEANSPLPASPSTDIDLLLESIKAACPPRAQSLL